MEDVDALIEDVYVFKLVRAAQAFKQYAHEVMIGQGIDLTSDQWIVLKKVSENPGINQRELASGIFKDPASVTRILDGLVKKELVEKRQGKDRRIYNIHLAFKGKKLVEKTLSLAVIIRKKGLEGLTREDQRAFKKALDTVFNNFRG
ncbi:transcriptional regulator, MarR family protein [Fulvivirga imtechensis AK7]|uniref:Transcriptional regulator, MarR family protein n=1 Tax=Fulvivirga imtechensis AK7 TaxID=1237149 RepID=L8JR41_9BACT|nr:MarR family transcriptional regulator [Fulvivirga imtechensis]ELR71325.1 transcriptional regulator, MarR family protein [Fulvivirga imtechensis AK7]